LQNYVSYGVCALPFIRGKAVDMKGVGLDVEWDAEADALGVVRVIVGQKKDERFADYPLAHQDVTQHPCARAHVQGDIEWTCLQIITCGVAAVGRGLKTPGRWGGQAAPDPESM